MNASISYGQKFGSWHVVSYEPRAKPRGVTESRMLAVCECGTMRFFWRPGLRGRVGKPCRCGKVKRYMRDKRLLPEFSSYRAMMDRCYREKHVGYHNYGGRGITVCERWRNSYEAFLDDMGAKPTPGHSIDRIDNDGNYEPGNCRWATEREQRRNSRCARMLTVDGVTQSIIEWSEAKGIPYLTMLCRLKRGWSVERAIRQPLQPHRSRGLTLPPDGDYRHAQEIERTRRAVRGRV